MNRHQKQTVREFIDLHNSRIDKHLREIGLLNANGTLPSNESVLKDLENWFFNVLNLSCSYTVNEIDVSLEIGRFDSWNGNPVDFEFDASLWPHFLEEC